MLNFSEVLGRAEELIMLYGKTCMLYKLGGQLQTLLCDFPIAIF